MFESAAGFVGDSNVSKNTVLPTSKMKWYRMYSHPYPHSDSTSTFKSTAVNDIDLVPCSTPVIATWKRNGEA
jgi:hypothetical protein